MNSVFTGGCACGRLRYRIAGDPVVMNDCQCRQCQRDSGTGHQSHVTFHGAAVETTGEPSHWRMIGEGGTIKERGFCPTCGSPVWMAFPDMPDLFIVTPASLDEPARYVAQAVLWTASGHSWDAIGPEVQRFEKMPPQG